MLDFFQRHIHPSYCFYACCAGFIFATALTVLFQLDILPSFFLFIAIVFLWISFLHASRFTILLAFVAGLIFANLRLLPDFTGQSYLEGLTGQQVTFAGKIINDPEYSGSEVTFQLSYLQHLDHDLATLLTSTLYVKINTSLELKRSDAVTLTGKLGAGFGTFAGSLYRPQLLNLTRPEPGDLFANLKQLITDLICAYVPSPEADLGLGYLMGLKSGLSKDFSEALRTVGMTHVIVASGAHLAILTGAAEKLFGKISKFAGLLATLLMVASFVLIVGFTPSMTRAALVTIIFLLFGYFGRKFPPHRLILLVATLTLITTPLNFLSLGWQLSFASFTGILLVAPYLQKLFYGGKHPPWLASMLLTSISTSLACAPILIYNFGALSLLSLVANLFILPTLPYAMLLLALVAATNFFSPLASIIAQLATWLLDFHIFVVNLLSQQTMFVLNLPTSDTRIFLLYLPLILLLLFPKIKKICYNKTNENPL